MNHSPSILRLAIVAAFAAPLAVPGIAVAQPTVTVVMQGLDNPRGLAFGPKGALFVAEAGRGGAPCPGTTGLNCLGLTGAVSRYWHGHQDRVATGLPSNSFPLGTQARGPHDIAMQGHHGHDGADVTIGLEADPASRPPLDRRGWLVHIPKSTLLAPSTHLCSHNCWSPVVDIAAYERVANPDGFNFESDPYALVAESRHGHGHHGHYGHHDNDNDDDHDDDDDGGEDEHGDGLAVTDASGNSLLRIDSEGEISTLAVFPSRPGRPTDSVPTALAVGPDGAYYVGEFTGFGMPLPPPNDAKVYRVVPGEAPTVFCSGFNRIIDIAFDDDGSLYILQYFPGSSPSGVGSLWHVVPPPPESPDRSCPDRQQVNTGVVLDQPTAIALGPDGALYLTTGGGRVGVGQVLRIQP